MNLTDHQRDYVFSRLGIVSGGAVGFTKIEGDLVIAEDQKPDYLTISNLLIYYSK